MIKVKPRRLLTVVMDGIGFRESPVGNAVHRARMPNLQSLKRRGLFTTLTAHGTAVGLPSDSDMGNSEVGHNTLGAGRVFDQGAKLVNSAIASGRIFSSAVWRDIADRMKGSRHTLHFISLLSDGNVHSHERHLHSLLRGAKDEGMPRVRVHVLLDGRDVGEKSAEIYADRLENLLTSLRSETFDARVASGGGRMRVTMDRYGADWEIVARGWRAHVLGQSENRFASLAAAIAHFRKDPTLTDQYLPEFVLVDERHTPVGTIEDGDAVLLTNFRGDRAIEISQAFEEDGFTKFDRQRHPRITYAGIMQYDGDLQVPKHFLVSPPEIKATLAEHLCGLGIRQFACSETQKFGHVTYFWNGNRSGFFDKKIEEYLEIPSYADVPFDRRPWMKAREITDALVDRLRAGTFDFGRINFANGDMVGHTGNLEATVTAVATVDLMLGEIARVCEETQTTLMVTADHGNADEMFEKAPAGLEWPEADQTGQYVPKTSHSLSCVPFVVFDPSSSGQALSLSSVPEATLANVANTILNLMGLPTCPEFHPSLVSDKR